MSNEDLDLEQVRTHLAEMNSFLAAIAKCQVPGAAVPDVNNLIQHIKEVIVQLNSMLLQATQKESITNE